MCNNFNCDGQLYSESNRFCDGSDRGFGRSVEAEGGTNDQTAGHEEDGRSTSPCDWNQQNVSKPHTVEETEVLAGANA